MPPIAHPDRQRAVGRDVVEVDRHVRDPVAAPDVPDPRRARVDEIAEPAADHVAAENSGAAATTEYGPRVTDGPDGRPDDDGVADGAPSATPRTTASTYRLPRARRASASR